jgi:hypothetical protein
MKKVFDFVAVPDGAGKYEKERMNIARDKINNGSAKKILVMKGKDSEEDILKLGKIVKKGDIVGIDTFPLHFKEYMELIKKARRDGVFPKKVQIKNIPTRQSFKLGVYGTCGYLEEKIKTRKLTYLKNRHEWLLVKIKNFVKLFFYP